MRAAVAAVRQEGPRRVVVAVPIASPETCAAFREEVDEAVCARTPERFEAVGMWYDDFRQTEDAEVHDLLEDARSWTTGRPGMRPPARPEPTTDAPRVG
jgi:predicted phosphoribosyltransferase